MVLRHVTETDILLQLSSGNQSKYLDCIHDTTFDKNIMKIAIDRGVDPNQEILVHGRESILIKVIKRNRYDIGCALISNGADIGYRNADGLTAFDIYASKNILLF